MTKPGKTAFPHAGVGGMTPSRDDGQSWVAQKYGSRAPFGARRRILDPWAATGGAVSPASRPFWGYDRTPPGLAKTLRLYLDPWRSPFI